MAGARLAAAVVDTRFALEGLDEKATKDFAKVTAPTLTTVHGLNSPGRYRGVMCRGERVVCVSDTVRAHVQRQWPGTDPAKLRVIPRGIDPAQFPRGHQAPESWRIAFAREFPALQDGRLLLMPGRGTRLKGHADALELLGIPLQRAGVGR